MSETRVRVTARRTGKNTALIEQFNEVCPIGTPVLYWPGERLGEARKSVTRSTAWLLGGHTPVVMVKGYAGGIALSHVMGYTPEQSTTTAAPVAAEEA
jgi:hypothetical protein